MESITVADVKGLKPNSGALTLFTNTQGGIEDDLIVSNADEHLYVVSNAGCRDKDIKIMMARLEKMKMEGADVNIELIDDRGLVALQGNNKTCFPPSYGNNYITHFLICLKKNNTFCLKDDVFQQPVEVNEICLYSNEISLKTLFA